MITENGKYYIYRHIRLDKNEPFYIGIGTKKKQYIGKTKMSAYARAYNTDSRSKYWYNITNSINWDVEVLLESNDKDFILTKEIEFIKLYGRVFNNTGSLVNIEDGGAHPKRQAHTIKAVLQTKRAKGTLGNAINLKNWMSSPSYINPKSKEVFMYGVNGVFIKKFANLQLCNDYIGVKGSVSFLKKKCDTKTVYKNKYIFTWEFMGDSIDIQDYRTDNMYYQPIAKVCPKTREVLKIYKTITDAGKDMGTNFKNVSSAMIISGKCCGFFWVKQNPINQQKQSS